MSNQPEPVTVFEAAGGQPAFERIIDRFYAGIETDTLLRPMYPADLTESRRHMVLFLMQYFGGPGTYSQERGHPRLRMRHAPYSIGVPERDAWMKHMAAAVKAEELAPQVEAIMMEYFERAATFMMNR
jgi:hemoglobin